MRRLFLITALLLLATAAIQPDVVNSQDTDTAPEIHCKHFIGGYPLGAPASNDMIIRDLYALSSNDETKFADWVCYRLTPQETFGDLDLKRKWHNDPWLDDSETLEARPESADDYDDAHSVEDYDRGHMAPLASFRGSRYASQVNFYSNITPQKADMNEGPWMRLESAERDLVVQYETIWVMTGTLYESSMNCLPGCDETHTVPSGFWKIVVVDDAGSLRAAGFIMGQDTPRGANFRDYLTTIQVIEARSGLDFFWELPAQTEYVLESSTPSEWVGEW